MTVKPGRPASKGACMTGGADPEGSAGRLIAGAPPLGNAVDKSRLFQAGVYAKLPHQQKYWAQEDAAAGAGEAGQETYGSA